MEIKRNIPADGLPPEASTPDACAHPGGAARPRRRYAAEEFRAELPRAIVDRFRRTNLAVSVGLALFAHASIVAIGAAMAILFMSRWPIALALYPLAATFIARQQRVLELLVHDGSHRAWCSGRPRLNDFLTNVLAAWPCFSDIASYWKFHRVHHMHYGSEIDPCKARFARMREAFEPRRTLATMARYTVQWYRDTFCEPLALARAAAWHACLVLAPLYLVAGAAALPLWLAFWLAPQLFFLPWLRFFAELEEHDYGHDKSELEGTFTNLGWIHAWLVHPMQDGYHLIHHAFASVPQWRHARLHKVLVALSVKYRQSLARRTVLGRVVPLAELNWEPDPEEAAR
jgi:fatty acid desaturase